MDAKLAAFRQRKYQNMQPNNLVKELKWAPSTNDFMENENDSKMQQLNPDKDETLVSVIENKVLHEYEVKREIEEKVWVKWSRLDMIEFSLKVIVWILLMALAVVGEVGAIFFTVSIFYLIFRNFRKTPRKPGELSAYSVFNPNFETINGTITAEQFERELVYGSAVIH